MPVTPRRRAYILEHLERGGMKGNWIKLTNQEFVEFGGHDYFRGLTIEHIQEQHEVQGGQVDSAVYNFSWKLIDRGNQGWRPLYYMTTTATNSTTLTLTNTLVSGQPSKGKQDMREHHIDRDRLIAQVNANKGTYELAYAKFKALYTDEVEALTQKHLDGLIGTNQIVVKDKDGNAITILADMSKTFDDQLRELELDSRDVVILDHEEYGQFVEGYATNLKQVQATAEKLEELQ